MNSLLAPWARWLVVLAALLVWAGYPSSLWFQSQQPTVAMPPHVVALSLAGAALALAALLRLFPDRSLRLPLALPGVAAALAAGLLLRLVVALWIAPVPASDGASYLQLAQSLAAGDGYGSSQTRAYWPPGQALALVPFLAVVHEARWAVLALNLLTFASAGLGIARLAAAVGLGRTPSAAVWLLALWPTSVLTAGLPEKEQLVIALMPWLLLSVWRLRSAEQLGAVAVLQAGVLLGAMVLVQPSLQLLPVAIALWWWLSGLSPRWVLLRFGALIVAMLLTLSPWTWRNLQVLGAPVLVSTNGGSNLYRANNELATGSYVLKGRVDLDHLEELEASRQGTRLAVEWITTHPGDFMRLAAGKLMLFSGDDSYGAYAALRRGQVEVQARIYAMAKLLAALPWLALWALMARAAWRDRAALAGAATTALLLLLPYAYLLALHAIFESGGKYHLPALPALLVLACWLSRSAQESAA